MRLTPEQIQEIKKLKENGMKSKEIALKFNVNIITIYYHINPVVKQHAIERAVKIWNNKNPEQRHAIFIKRKDYIKNYMKNRYQNDPVFRQNCIDRQKKYNLNKKENGSSAKV